MKHLLLAFASLLFVNSVHAQTEPPTQEKQSQDAKASLPDNPIPVQPGIQDGPAPCPAGVGIPCSLLGGRLYFPDPMHMTEHNKTLWQVATSPGMVAAYALNMAGTIVDIEGTQACLHANTCREADPIFGSHPSRARAYGTAIPLNLANYAAAAYLKKYGKGNLAFGLLWATTVAHVYFGASGFAHANNPIEPAVSSVARQKLTLSIRF